MKMQFLKSRRKNRAFTLIEMLVVVLILAILAALIVPRVVNRTGDAKQSKAKSDIATLSSLLQAYQIDNGAFPTTEQGLNALRVAPSDATNWKGPYTSKELPADPWQNDYVYEAPGPDGEDFVIASYGADGAPGGEAEAADITSQ